MPIVVHAYDDIRAHMKKMSLEEKVGQLFVFGFKQKTFDKDLKAFLESKNPGGLLFFSRNGRSPKNVANLINNIKLHYKDKTYLEPLLMVDHEGGEVVRVGPSHLFPSALSLGETKNTSLSYQLGFWTGKYLKSVGFDVNFAPVVDLRSEDKANFIGDRSFSSKPASVVKIVKPLIAGMQSSGILPVLKHFPGHGRLKGDTHHELVRKVSSASEIINKDIKPFKDLIRIFPQIGVMSSHLSVPALDSSGELTTFSKPIISTLSDDFHHSGLRFTDDLDMLYFKNKKLNWETKVVDALNAGHDQILIIWSARNQNLAYQAVLKSVKEKKISMEFLNKRVEKVLRAKYRHKYLSKNFNHKDINKSLKEIYKLQTEISQVHFNKLPDSLFEDIAKSDSEKGPYLFSFSSSFAKIFKSTFDNSGFIPLSYNKWKNYLQTCKKRLCFFHVSGDKSGQRAKQIPKELQPYLFILNTTDPIITKDLKSKKINVYSLNKNLWKWMKKKLISLNPSYAKL